MANMFGSPLGIICFLKEFYTFNFIQYFEQFVLLMLFSFSLCHGSLNVTRTSHWKTTRSDPILDSGDIVGRYLCNLYIFKVSKGTGVYVCLLYRSDLGTFAFGSWATFYVEII